MATVLLLSVFWILIYIGFFHSSVVNPQNTLITVRLVGRLCTSLFRTVTAF